MLNPENSYFQAVLRFIRAAPPAPRLPNLPPIPTYLSEAMKRDPFAETIYVRSNEKGTKDVSELPDRG